MTLKRTFTIFLILLGSASTMSSANAFSISIDSGHSPGSRGALSCSGKSEYLYNNELAKTVVTFLRNNKIPVAVTHQENEERSLLERATSARGNDLLLSLHHDSVQPQFLSKQSVKGSCSEKARGFSIFVSRKNPHYEKSLQYAKALGSALLKRELLPALHHAEAVAGENRELIVPEKGIYLFDDLVILKRAEIPAILLEAAVVVHPDDEQLAADPTFRATISEAVYEMLNQAQKPAVE